MRLITFGEEESYSRYYVFKKGVHNPRKVLDMMGFDTDSLRSTSPYDCTGRWYHSAVDFVLRGKWLIGSQRFWLDV